MEQAIERFFSERKERWLRKNLKESMSEEKKSELIKECESRYEINGWFSFAIENAQNRALTSHPTKFSHPDTGASQTNRKKGTYVTPVICFGTESFDGYLRTGNIKNLNLDSIGNGAEVNSLGEVGELLGVIMTDGRRFFEHLQDDSENVKNFLNAEGLDYLSVKSGLLAMIRQDCIAQTNSRIKQVFFPVDADYHQLSILVNSGAMFELRKRLRVLSIDARDAKEKKKNNQHDDEGFSEIYQITEIGFGGTKPQNISTLNNQNGGKAHLLSSLPPTIEKRTIRFPKTNFFTESFRAYECRDVFQALHKIYKTGYNNARIREGRDYRLQEIIDRLIARMWAVRSVSSNQYNDDNSRLKGHQLTWLLGAKLEDREVGDQWLDVVVKEISRWVVTTYEQIMGKNAFKLGKEELNKITEIVEKNREALR